MSERAGIVHRADYEAMIADLLRHDIRFNAVKRKVRSGRRKKANHRG